MIEAGYKDFAGSLESHPRRRFDEVRCEIRGWKCIRGNRILNFWTAGKVPGRDRPPPAFGFNFDPSHFYWQMVDPG